MSKVNEINGYDIWHGVHKCGYSDIDVMLNALGIKKFSSDNDEEEAQDETFFTALESLDKAGLIYQVVSVMDREAGNNEAQVIYELDAKSKHGYKPAGEEGLGGETARLSNIYGNPVTDSTGRFYGRYAAIVPAGEPHIVGIYRLRFRVSNSKNHGVATAWARIYQGQREAKEWLTNLANKTEKQTTKKEKLPF
jgi:hypothetical protein